MLSFHSPQSSDSLSSKLSCFTGFQFNFEMHIGSWGYLLTSSVLHPNSVNRQCTHWLFCNLILTVSRKITWTFSFKAVTTHSCNLRSVRELNPTPFIFTFDTSGSVRCLHPLPHSWKCVGCKQAVALQKTQYKPLLQVALFDIKLNYRITLGRFALFAGHMARFRKWRPVSVETKRWLFLV